MKTSTNGKRRYQLQSLPRLTKKPDELWSTNRRVYLSGFDPPKVNFVGYHISAPRVRCRLKFLHALENDQGFLAHTPLGMGVPPTIFNDKHSKIGLKIWGMHPYNFGAMGNNLTKLFQVTCRDSSKFF